MDGALKRGSRTDRAIREEHMAYSEKVIEHYEHPRNVGTLDKEDPNVGTGLVGAPACGDVMRLQIRVNPETGVVEDAKFKTFGCGSAIASSSLVTEWVKGKTLDEAMTIKNSQIVEELNLPPVKIHCSVLAEDAIKSAIADFRRKQQETEQTSTSATTTTTVGEIAP
jgi:nitrogen fixation NifU-like protein